MELWDPTEPRVGFRMDMVGWLTKRERNRERESVCWWRRGVASIDPKFGYAALVAVAHNPSFKKDLSLRLELLSSPLFYFTHCYYEYYYYCYGREREYYLKLDPPQSILVATAMRFMMVGWLVIMLLRSLVKRASMVDSTVPNVEAPLFTNC